MKIIEPTWTEIEVLVEQLAMGVRCVFHNRLFSLCGIPRGGQLVAVMLAHRLNCKLVQSVEHLMTSLPHHVPAEHLVLVDDVVNTGTTLDLIMSKAAPQAINRASCFSLYGPATSQAKRLSSPVWYHNQGSPFASLPIFFTKKLDNEQEWIRFPWESRESPPIEDRRRTSEDLT
jgi:hypoxanthine phosphoribosyltransferase